MFLTPIALAIGLLLLLLLLYRLLRRSTAIAEVRLLYFGATLLAAATVLLDGEGLLPPGLLRNLLVAGLIVAWGYIIFDLAEGLLLGQVAPQGSIPISRLVRDILRATALIALVLLVVNQIFGVPLSSLVISSTVASAVVGLALQDLLRDVIAGIALQTERPYRPNDWIEVDGQIGKVLEMSWRATRLVTVDNTHVIVPNATLARARINNYTLISPLQALHVQILVSPQHPPTLVKATLISAALVAEGVLSEPRPAVRLVAYGEYSVTYDIKFWMRGFERYIETRDAVMTSAWYLLQRANIRQPTPQREIFLHQAASALPDDQRGQQVARFAKTLKRVEIFSVLTADELHALASHVELRIYCAGEVLARQGDHDDALFAINSGHVRVEVVAAPGTPPIVVNHLGPGEVFGELVLLTNAPRGATVIAEGDIEALVVHREAIAPLLAQNPALPEQLGAVFERRKAHTASLVLASQAATSPDEVVEGERSFVSLIRGLFGLG